MLIEKTKKNLVSLPVKVILEVTGYEYYPETIWPAGKSVEFLYSQHKTEGRKGHVSYFVDKGAGAAGMAAGGVDCQLVGLTSMDVMETVYSPMLMEL